MNLQTKNNQKGFTIVELLIVIVVIGILAAITIVAYNGIQKRANESAAQSAANSVLKKAEAYNAVESSYPATTEFDDIDESTLEGVSLGTPTAATGKSTVLYALCGTTGAEITYWDYQTGTLPVDSQLKMGTGC